MNLVNFDLATNYDAIELDGLGLKWDLHNVLEFRGFDFDAAASELLLRWEGTPNCVVDEGTVLDNPLGYVGCILLFRGVEFLRLETIAAGGDHTCLHAVSKVRPGDSDYRHRLDWTLGEPLHLVFEFQSGRILEVGAREAELRGVVLAAA